MSESESPPLTNEQLKFNFDATYRFVESVRVKYHNAGEELTKADEVVKQKMADFQKATKMYERALQIASRNSDAYIPPNDGAVSDLFRKKQLAAYVKMFNDRDNTSQDYDGGRSRRPQRRNKKNNKKSRRQRLSLSFI
jgi:hypothetical protein